MLMDYVSVSDDSSSDDSSVQEIAPQRKKKTSPKKKAPTPVSHDKNKKAKKETQAADGEEKNPNAHSTRFTGQAELKKWFAELPKEQQDAVRAEFNLFIIMFAKKTTNGCLELQFVPSGIGIVSREKDEGRMTIKPYVWVNNKVEGVTVPKTTDKFRGPEINLAAFWATINGCENHDVDELVCSHLCHNKKCVNIDHLCWEVQDLNNHRNFCKVISCNHKPKCICNGTAANLDGKDAKTLIFDKTTGKFVKAA